MIGPGFLSVMSKYEGPKKMIFLGIPEVGEKQKVYRTKWKSTKMEDDQNQMEDNRNGRWPKWKEGGRNERKAAEMTGKRPK